MKTKKPTRKRIRLKGYNYARDGYYFFTTNVKNNNCFFGEIRKKKMYLNQFGVIVLQQWYWLEEQYPYIILHDFVVMPNHVHGIIEIKRENVFNGKQHEIDWNDKIKPLPDLIGAFKMTTSKLIRSLQSLYGCKEEEEWRFEWQRSYHDHIIKSQRAFNRISNYIRQNPGNWNLDMYYPRRV